MNYSSKQRMLTAIDGGIPDRLPVTTHHVQRYFLDKYMGGMSNDQFFEHFGFDPIVWTLPYCPDVNKGEFFHVGTDNLTKGLISSDRWRIECEDIFDEKYKTVRYTIFTPKKNLTMVLQSNDYTCWVGEHLIKNKSDIELIREYVTSPKCDVAAVNQVAEQYGDKALIRGNICCFDLFGQPGTWQDAACLFGIENLIMATFDDPNWVHQFLKILQMRKKIFIKSLEGAKYDILELGGGDASSTVISPKIFDNFVAPYDSELISMTHKAGQKVVYHTCGGMMPILENIAAMQPDAMETFTPSAMGGDVDLAEARRRIPKNICMIGGFDQFHFFDNGTSDETRAEVRRCFKAAGQNGSFILSPSDHFFDAKPDLVMAFADEARKCKYQV